MTNVQIPQKLALPGFFSRMFSGEARRDYRRVIEAGKELGLNLKNNIDGYISNTNHTQGLKLVLMTGGYPINLRETMNLFFESEKAKAEMLALHFDYWIGEAIDGKLEKIGELIDGRFEQRADGMYLLQNHRFNPETKDLVPTFEIRLEDNVLRYSCFVDLKRENFNKYGLPIKCSQSKKYRPKRGESLFYLAPEEGKTICLVADPNNPNILTLNCTKNPLDADAWRGIRYKEIPSGKS